MNRGERVDSVGMCSRCGYRGPGPKHDCRPLYQTVEITLTDGRKGSFTGPMLVTEQDHRAGVAIRTIKFVEARPLPPGMYFESLEPTHDPGCHEPSCAGCAMEAPERPATPPEGTAGTVAPAEAPEAPHGRPRGRKQGKGPSAPRARKRST